MFMKISAPNFGCEMLGGHFSAKVERNPKKNKQNLLLESPRIAKMAILPFEGGLVYSTFCLTTLSAETSPKYGRAHIRVYLSRLANKPSMGVARSG